MSEKGLLPDAGLPRNPGSFARMESGQQPGVLEFPHKTQTSTPP